MQQIFEQESGIFIAHSMQRKSRFLYVYWSGTLKNQEKTSKYLHSQGANIYSKSDGQSDIINLIRKEEL